MATSAKSSSESSTVSPPEPDIARAEPENVLEPEKEAGENIAEAGQLLEANSSKKSGGSTRRDFIKAAGAVAATSSTAGCIPDTGKNNTETETATDTETSTGTSTETDDDTPTPPQTGRIEFVPKDASGDEDWLANPMFDDDKFTGPITYEVNIDEALQHRSIVEDQAEEYPEITEIINNFWENGWTEEFWKEYRSGNEDLREEGFDEQEYQSHESLDNKLTESHLHDFILSYESYNNDWEISSTYRDALAGILEELIDPERENFLFSPHEIANLERGSLHGMVWALQNYASHRENYESEEEYRQAKQQVESFMVDTPKPAGRKFNEGSENISECDYTTEGEWEYENFAHFVEYDGEGVDRGVGASEDMMRSFVSQAFNDFTMNQNHDRSMDIRMDPEFAQDLADYAMNPSESELTGSFIKEYSAAIRDMDESGRFEGKDVTLGRDYVEVA